MSDFDRSKHFEEQCKEENTPIDPCLPIKPQGLHSYVSDPCNPTEFNECKVDGFIPTDGAAATSPPNNPDQLYNNTQILLTCGEAFGDQFKATNYEDVQVVVNAGEFSSFISQSDADQQAQAVAVSRLSCTWGNELLDVQCPDDSDGYPADGGDVQVEPNEFTVQFKDDGTDYTEVARVNQEEANQLAQDFADATLNCYWNNDERTLNCSQLEKYTHLKQDPINKWFTNGQERLDDGSILLTEGVVQSFLAENPDAGKADANVQAVTFGETQLICLFENLKMTVYCCEPWQQDQSKNGWKVDSNNQVQAGTLPADNKFNSDGLQYYYDNHESRDKGPTLENADIYVYDPDTQTSSLVQYQEVIKLPAIRDDSGLTKRCNNPFIDDHYDNSFNSNASSPVIVEIGASSSEIEGEAFESAVTIAQAQLECAWTNDFQPGAECPVDPDGYPVDPRSSGSPYNPVSNVPKGQFYSKLSKADVTEQATAFNLLQTDCYWTNFAMDVRCNGCQKAGPSGILEHKYSDSPDSNVYERGTLIIEKNKAQYTDWPQHPHFKDQPKYSAIDFNTKFYDDPSNPNGSILPPRVYNRRNNTVHTLFDHNGERMLKDMVQYYKDYEYLYQLRTIESATTAQLPSIDEQLLEEYWLLSENSQKVRMLQQEALSDADIITNKRLDDLYYDHTKGLNAGTCLDYTQPVTTRELWDFQEDGNGKVKVELEVETDANIQTLVETGNFRSTSSQEEADNLAYLYGVSVLNCYYENDLLDVRCEDCSLHEELEDNGDTVVTTSSDALPEKRIDNAVIIENDSDLGDDERNWYGLTGEKLRDNWGDVVDGYYRMSDLDEFKVENTRNNRNYNSVENRDGVYPSYDYDEAELQDRDSTVDIDPTHNYTFKKSNNNNAYGPDSNYAAEESVHVEQECVKNKNGFGSGSNDNEFLSAYNICNYAKGSTVRIMVDAGQFRSYATKVDANQLATAFGQGQLNCFWDSPSLHRYCKFCGYNTPNHEICDYNGLKVNNCAGNVAESGKRHPDCNSCYDNDTSIVPSVGQDDAGCAVTTTSNSEENARYKDVNTDCCCSKYAGGASTEVLLEASIVQSTLSLAEAVDLGKKIAEAQLNCLYGNDEIIISCKDDFDTFVVNPSDCESSNDDVQHYIPKDTHTSFKSFNEAQQFAEDQAKLMASLKCQSATKWSTQTWTTDTNYAPLQLPFFNNETPSTEVTNTVKEGEHENVSLNVNIRDPKQFSYEANGIRDNSSNTLYPYVATLVSNPTELFYRRENTYTNFLYDFENNVAYNLNWATEDNGAIVQERIAIAKFDQDLYLLATGQYGIFTARWYKLSLFDNSAVFPFIVTPVNEQGLRVLEFADNSKNVFYDKFTRKVYRAGTAVNFDTIQATVTKPYVIFQDTYCMADCDGVLGRTKEFFGVDNLQRRYSESYDYTGSAVKVRFAKDVRIYDTGCTPPCGFDIVQGSTGGGGTQGSVSDCVSLADVCVGAETAIVGAVGKQAVLDACHNLPFSSIQGAIIAALNQAEIDDAQDYSAAKDRVNALWPYIGNCTTGGGADGDPNTLDWLGNPTYGSKPHSIHQASIHVGGRQFSKTTKEGAAGIYSNVPLAVPLDFAGNYTYGINYFGSKVLSLVFIVRDPDEFLDIDARFRSAITARNWGSGGFTHIIDLHGVDNGQDINDDVSYLDRQYAVKDYSHSHTELFDFSPYNNKVVDFYAVSCDSIFAPAYNNVEYDSCGVLGIFGFECNSKNRYIYSNWLEKVKSSFVVDINIDSPIALDSTKSLVNSPCE